MPPELYRLAIELVEHGEYDSVEDLLERAVHTQLALEAEAMAKGGANGDSSTAPRDGMPTYAATALMPAFDLTGAAASTPLPADVPPVERRLREGDRIWGQVNRILPLKVVCRRLLVLASGRDSWPTVGALEEQLVAHAAGLGSILEKTDRVQGRKRDQLATGLPRTDNPASRERFFTQFVARVPRTGKLQPGAVAQYGLAVFTDKTVSLTDLGITFGRMVNPVLDIGVRSAGSTLSDEERAYFTQRVIAEVPAELEDFRVILGAIGIGHATPETLHGSVGEAYRVRGWSEIQVRTHVSGVVARMVDLGLVRRQWQGRKVLYTVSPAAVMVPQAGAMT